MVAFSYMMMFGKNGLLTFQLLGVRTNIFGWHGLWLSQTISFFPVAAVVIEGVLRSISPNVEYAGRNLGATGFRLFRTVTLPLARPGIAGAALLVSIQVLADFGNPIMIGGSFSVLATEAWLRVEGWGDVKGAAVLSSLLLVPSLVLFVAQRLWVGRRTYATLTGRAGIADIPRVGPVVRLSLFAFCLLTSILVILVYAALVIGAFVKGWGFDWTPDVPQSPGGGVAQSRAHPQSRFRRRGRAGQHPDRDDGRLHRESQGVLPEPLRRRGRHPSRGTAGHLLRHRVFHRLLAAAGGPVRHRGDHHPFPRLLECLHRLPVRAVLHSARYRRRSEKRQATSGQGACAYSGRSRFRSSAGHSSLRSRCPSSGRQRRSASSCSWRPRRIPWRHSAS